MEQTDQELLRRTLISIVKRIEGVGSIPVVVSERSDHTSSLDKSQEATEPPLVIILVGQAGSTKDEDYEKQASYEATTGGKIGSDMSHPGFERFQISHSCAADAPKPCFMEPDKICVNSGACEMLGH